MNQDDAFDEAFEELQKRGISAQFNVAQLHAISKAQQFVEETGTELGIYTLRKAFELGFIRGYMFAKEQNK
jgi:hypothetical protein